ncbi:DUF6527 family protein [Bradyrhizobium pachyrhizi]|uniref:DUF6527 family protein n=1 Tax=Bradyrhizobium pachyrhizi TaxID=280333 RepID=UPI0009E1A459|nr:DUF6527 family protein [Bradyrhizobium pachyrhizi]
MKTITLQRVQYLPKQLSSDILYVSEEYAVAGHLCACGCGSKVITPLNPAGWNFTERDGRPTLRPSIGNWQLPCRSHYLITNGVIQWAGQWSDEQIAAGRRAEEMRRQAYYASRTPEQSGFWSWLWQGVRQLFGGK